MRNQSDARISIVEKSVFTITFCRFATMRVANSRILMLPNSEIRQNKGIPTTKFPFTSIVNYEL